jgi:hypothetical protein
VLIKTASQDIMFDGQELKSPARVAMKPLSMVDAYDERPLAPR